MNQRAERRKKNQRVSQAMFYDAIADRRRQDYERRGRTKVTPVPLEIAVSGDRRKFPESGSE